MHRAQQQQKGRVQYIRTYRVQYSRAVDGWIHNYMDGYSSSWRLEIGELTNSCKQMKMD
jgi:hypothetical protein